jgi:plasmid stabilization system protein ParE
VSPSFRVSWAEVAVRDLEEIAHWIARPSPAVARRLIDRLSRRASTLVTLPERGRRVAELEALGVLSFRELVERPYRILCRVHGRQVLVLAVLDGRRRLEDLLIARLLRQ